jgi:transcriptional regulator with XRE-family HTH domain
MDKAELKQALKVIGWSQARLARECGISPVTVCGWKKVPGPVAKVVKMVLAAKRYWESVK